MHLSEKIPTLHRALDLEPIRFEILLPPRLARRLRIRAHEEHRMPARVAARLLAQALEPDAKRLRHIIERDLAEVQR